MLTIEYPRFAFAFNPIVILATTDAETISFTANGHTITRPSRGASTPIYIQAIAQSLFDRTEFNDELSDTALFKRMEFTVTAGADGQLGSIDILWGAMQFGETYTQDKTLMWFRGMPFRVPLYLSSTATVRYRIDGGEIQASEVLTDLPAGKWNLPVDATTFPGVEDARDSLQVVVGGGAGVDVFDYTFDHTFHPVARESILMSVGIRDCTNGIYLRWINKYGEYCYYLFDDGTSSNAIQNGSVNLNEFVRTLEIRHGYNAGSNRPTEKNAQKSVRLFASLVDKNAFNMLEGLPESPVVDLYMGPDESGAERWLGVNIAPGTFTRTKSVLQDFECTMLYPATFNQSL